MKPAWHDVIATLAEVTSGPAPEVARKQTEARMRLLGRRVPTLVWSTDVDLRLTSCLGAGLEGLDRRPEHLVGCRLADCVPDREVHLAAHRRALQGEAAEYEATWLGRWFACQVEPFVDADGVVTGTIGAALDVTVLRRVQEELSRSTLRDGLTGLPTRTAFHERLAEVLSASERPSCAVLLVNLDGFKAINDSLGCVGGDEVLAEVGRRLEDVTRSRDVLARFAGDEFTVLLEEVADVGSARRGAERVLACLARPIAVGGREVVPQASAGLAMARAGQGSEDLMREAESALLEAKAKGRGRCHVFEGPLDSRALALLRMEAELRRALDRDEFRTHYEPTIAVKGSKVTGFEVVLWRRSQRGRSA
ncbi:MAG TPA: diguanylate cyclase [Vicinamibacteria bacterium]|jgi:diguanylate cyclase (GGDEF)-like protein